MKKMDDTDKEVLRKNRTYLVDNILPDQLYDYLIESDVFNSNMIDYIKKERTSMEQNQRMLNDLTRRGPNAFYLFCECLERSGHGYIAQRLRQSQSGCDQPPATAPGQRTTGGAPLATPSDSTTKSENGPTVHHANFVSPDAPLIRSRVSHTESGCYTMRSNPRGLMLIINNKNFSNRTERRGTDIDAQNLERLFQRCGFKNVCPDCRNLPAAAMKQKIRDVSQSPELRRVDSLLLVILSHGESDKVFGSDDDFVTLEWIFTKFNAKECPALKDKPKLFIIQACREEPQPEVQNSQFDSFSSIQNIQTRNAICSSHPDAHRVVAYPTLPGSVAFRNTESGSWYIEALCEVFEEDVTTEHVLDMLVKVNAIVAARVFDLNFQMPQPEFTLCKKWYLNPPRNY